MSCGCLKKQVQEEGIADIVLKKAKEYAVESKRWYVVYRCKGGNIDLMPLDSYTDETGSLIAYLSPY